MLCHKSLPHWKKLEVIPKMGYLRHLPLLPQCTVTAFVYSKFQYGMNICITPQTLVNTISAIKYLFETKIAFSIYGSEETLVTNVLYDGQSRTIF